MVWAKTSPTSRGYGAAWVKLRKAIMARDKHLCQPCLRLNRATPATAVDHITPKAKGGTDSPGNLQAICTPCHDAKTIVDAGGRARQTIGVDGWPVHKAGGVV